MSKPLWSKQLDYLPIYRLENDFALMVEQVSLSTAIHTDDTAVGELDRTL